MDCFDLDILFDPSARPYDVLYGTLKQFYGYIERVVVGDSGRSLES